MQQCAATHVNQLFQDALARRFWRRRNGLLLDLRPRLLVKMCFRAVSQQAAKLTYPDKANTRR